MVEMVKSAERILRGLGACFQANRLPTRIDTFERLLHPSL